MSSEWLEAFIISLAVACIITLSLDAIITEHDPVSETEQHVEAPKIINAEDAKYIVNGYLEFDTLSEALVYAQDNISGEIIMVKVEVVDIEPDGNTY